MKKKEINRFYEEFHKLENNPINIMMEDARYKLLKKLLKKVNGKILVIGCGSKDEMGSINKKSNGVGIDISKTAIEKSKKRYPRFEYHIMDAINLKFKSNSFDVVVCSEVIEHIEDDERVLDEVRRVLKDSGTFIVTTPNWWSLYGLARKIAENLFKEPFTSDDQPIDNWSTPTSLRKKLSKYFKIKRFYGLWYYPPTGKGKIRIPGDALLPFFWLFYPVEFLLRRILPWFGHSMIFVCFKKTIKYQQGI